MTHELTKEVLEELKNLAKSAKEANQFTMIVFVKELLSLVSIAESYRWIPVGERMPERAEDVLVFAPTSEARLVDSQCAVAYLNGAGVWYESISADEKKGITHWCPLLAPPKQEERK